MHYRLRRVVRQLYELGDLSWKLDEHQDKYIYQHYRDWEKRRHKDKGANRIWMLDAGRQVGKTHCCSIIRLEDCFQHPRSRYIYASATEIALKEFIITNIEGILEDCPPDLAPAFKQRYKGTRAHFRWPNGAALKLVGIDEDPKGLRGPGLNGGTIGEAAFVTKLKATIGGELYPQMQRYPDATLMLESSAPKDLDHDYDVVFKPSCEARKAYVFMTIHDNTALSEETKQEYLDAAREIDPVDADREYLGKRVRSVKGTVFPEFDKQLHCIPVYELPKHGIALASYDPGQKHLFGVSWSVYDYLTTEVTFVDDWSEHNASTERVAAITAARELDLFGTKPPAQLHRLSLNEWIDLLGDDRTQHLAEQLHEMSNKRHKDVRAEDYSEFKWYDNESKAWRYNPHLRVSDTSSQLIRDMAVMFGMFLDPTTKDDLREVMVQLVRSKLKQKQIKIGPLAANTANHLNACTWDKTRHKWLEHNVWSHFDLAATVVYAMRYWESYYWIDPYPPEHLGKAGTDWVGDVRTYEEPAEYGEHW